MAGNLPLPAGSHPPLPAVTIRVEALREFAASLDQRLKELEERFGRPRQHPRLVLRDKWKKPRRPR